MRRISDGVKVAERWRTTEMVEKATVDEREYDFLYEDGEGFHFMEPSTYEQLTASADVVGEDKVFLTEGIKVYLQTFEGVPIAIELPQTRDGRDHRDGTGGQGADGVVVLQARDLFERSAGDGAAAYRGWARGSSSTRKTIPMSGAPRTDGRVQPFFPIFGSVPARRRAMFAAWRWMTSVPRNAVSSAICG